LQILLIKKDEKPNSKLNVLERRAAIVSAVVGFAQEVSAPKLSGKTPTEQEKYLSAIRAHVFNTFSTVGEVDPIRFLGAQKATQVFHVNDTARK